MTTQRGYRYDPAATYAVREFDQEYLRVGEVTRQVRIYQPEGPGPFPILLSVHGGAWSNGDHTNNPTTSKTAEPRASLPVAWVTRQTDQAQVPRTSNKIAKPGMPCVCFSEIIVPALL